MGVLKTFVMLGSFTTLEFQPQIAVKHTTRSQRETKRDSLPWQVLYKYIQYIEGCYRLGHYLFSIVSCATASIIAGFLGGEQGSFLSMSATKEVINRTCGHPKKLLIDAD